LGNYGGTGALHTAGKDGSAGPKSLAFLIC